MFYGWVRHAAAFSTFPEDKSLSLPWLLWYNTIQYKHFYQAQWLTVESNMKRWWKISSLTLFRDEDRFRPVNYHCRTIRLHWLPHSGGSIHSQFRFRSGTPQLHATLSVLIACYGGRHGCQCPARRLVVGSTSADWLTDWRTTSRACPTHLLPSKSLSERPYASFDASIVFGSAASLEASDPTSESVRRCALYWRRICRGIASFLPTSGIDSIHCIFFRWYYLAPRNSFYRAMQYSAKRGIAIACRPSVCPSVTLVEKYHRSSRGHLCGSSAFLYMKGRKLIKGRVSVYTCCI